VVKQDSGKVGGAGSLGNGTDSTKLLNLSDGVENFEKNSELKLLRHFSKFSIRKADSLSTAG